MSIQEALTREDRLKKEVILRDELRAINQLIIRTMRWSITTLISLLAGLYYIRSQLCEKFIKLGKIPPDSIFLPFRYHIIGTMLIFIMASIFSFITLVLFYHYSNYRRQLFFIIDPINENNYSIKQPIVLLIFILYFLFPMLDIMIAFYIKM